MPIRIGAGCCFELDLLLAQSLQCIRLLLQIHISSFHNHVLYFLQTLGQRTPGDQGRRMPCRCGASSERAMIPTAEFLHPYSNPGITLLQADNFDKWLFTIEVMGDSLYVVCTVAAILRVSNATHSRAHCCICSTSSRVKNTSCSSDSTHNIRSHPQRSNSLSATGMSRLYTRYTTFIYHLNIEKGH